MRSVCSFLFHSCSLAGWGGTIAHVGGPFFVKRRVLAELVALILSLMFSYLLFTEYFGPQKWRLASAESRSLSGILFRLVKKGRVGRLQSLLTQSLFADENPLTSSTSADAAALYLLASFVDSRGRRLLHVSCEHGRTKMLRYLLNIGLPVEVYDKKGNTPFHSCIKYGIKHCRFSKCCKLLACLLKGNSQLFYVRNNEGSSPSFLLEQLWQLATPVERTKGDAILARCNLEEDLSTVFQHLEERTDDAFSDVEWKNRLVDELNADLPHYEHYFEGFPDGHASSGDPFEDIRMEYERKKRGNAYQTRRSRDHPSTSTTEESATKKTDEFRRRYAEGLRKLGLASATSTTLVSKVSFEEYSKQWQTFMRSGESRAIPWPPVRVGDMHELLQFVGRSLAHLRQLQVDWHPDRFFARLPSNIQRTKEMVNRVTELSQFFNTAVAKMRG